MWQRAICIEVVFSELHTASFRSRARWLLSLCMQRVVDGNVWLYSMCVQLYTCMCILFIIEGVWPNCDFKAQLGRIAVWVLVKGGATSYRVCGLITTL